MPTALTMFPLIYTQHSLLEDMKVVLVIDDEVGLMTSDLTLEMLIPA